MLPLHLRAIFKRIDETVDKADRSANDRSKSAEEAQKEVAAAVHNIANEFKAYEAKQSESEPKKDRRERLTILSLIVTTAVTVALAVIAALQWQTLEKQWATLEKTDVTLRDTLETNRASQRPFVTVRELKIEAGDRLKYRDPAQKYWTFQVQMENSGSTVTRNLKVYHGYAFANGPGPGDITLAQLSQGGGNASVSPGTSPPQ